MPSIGGFGDVAGCIGCLVEDAAVALSNAVQGAPLAPLLADDRKCHGAIGKTYVFAVWAWQYSMGSMTAFALLGGVGDLVFAATFFVFLWKVHNR